MVKRYFPIAIALLFVMSGLYIVISKKAMKRHTLLETQTVDLGQFGTQKNCVQLPHFLKRMGTVPPVMIDLSQKHYYGIALLSGKNLQSVLHPKQWEQYGYLGTYTLDEQGNIFLVPMPFISIHPTTFNLQKNLYVLDSNTGKLSIFMKFDDVEPSANNPYGINAITYDCDDRTLWVSAIDKSDYQHQKGRIYHIDPAKRKVLETIHGFDALSLALLHTSTGKYLIAGSARDNGLYAYKFKQKKITKKPQKLLELPASNERIRKIRIRSKNRIELQSIPFTYSLIAQSTNKDRRIYIAYWDPSVKKFKIVENK